MLISFKLAGPLTTVVNGKSTLVGVTSFGITCNPWYPAGYARVSSQKAWILSNTDVANYPCGALSKKTILL